MQAKTRQVKSFTVFYKNEFEVDFLIEEIFNQGCYHFHAEHAAPVIVDCGAHIGMSVLYFKSLYPNARVIAFEPDKQSFELLEKNVRINNLTDVSIFNVALSDFSGVGMLYGDFSISSESVGNSLISGWGDRDGFSRQEVSIRMLSEFIPKGPIDYLKVDTEGTELAILKDISFVLPQVGNIFVEFHQFTTNHLELDEIKNLLELVDFKLDVYHLELKEVLAEKYPVWSEREQPVVQIIKGKKARL